MQIHVIALPLPSSLLSALESLENLEDLLLSILDLEGNQRTKREEQHSTPELQARLGCARSTVSYWISLWNESHTGEKHIRTPRESGSRKAGYVALPETWKEFFRVHAE